MQLETFYKKYFTPGRIVSDSRKIKKDDIFIALKGDNFNGNEYALQAIDSGARVAVVDEKINSNSKQLILVENTLSFLQDLARHHVQQCNFEVIGLTGSNGKTTTKELLYSVLNEQFKVQATAGNFNNHIGVPLTLLSINYDTEFAIVEMGANHIGEIAQLCEIAQPKRGVITNIGKAHLEGFGSFNGVIEAKSELYNYIISNLGKIYINQPDKILQSLVKGYANCIAYNSEDGICSGNVKSNNPLVIELHDSLKNSAAITSQLFGEYNLTNILAAAAIGLDLKLDIAQIKAGIEKYTPSNNRSQVHQIGSVNLVLDCYNANPSSMSLALKEFKKYNLEETVVIVGEMKELGDYSQKEHEDIVKLVKQLNFDHAIFLGESYKNLALGNGKYCSSLEEAIQHLDAIELEDINILIKGSRSNYMENIGDYLIQKLS